MNDAPIVSFDKTPYLLNKVIEYFKENGDHGSDDDLRKTAQQYIYIGVPDSWQSLLDENKLKLWRPHSTFIFNARNGYYEDVDFRLVVSAPRKTKPDIAYRQALLHKHPNNGTLVKIVSSVDQWESPWRCHKKTIAYYNQKKYSVWTFETPLLAHQRFTYHSRIDSLAAAWRVRIELLIPVGRQHVEEKDRLPIIRVVVLDSIEDASVEGVDVALFETIQTCINEYVETIEYYLLSDSEDGPDLKYISEIYFPNSVPDRAKAFASWYGAVLADADKFYFSHDKIPLVSTVSTQHPIDQDYIQKKIITDPPAPLNFDVIQLFEFDISNVKLLGDGNIYQTYNVEDAQSFQETFSISPSSVLQQSGFDLEEFSIGDRSNQYDYLKMLEEVSDFSFSEIRDALVASHIPKGKGRSPTAHLLINLATGAHVIDVTWTKKPIGPFLQKAFPKIQSLDKDFAPALKVTSIMLSKHKDIQVWASKNHTNIIKPKSGFDSGIHIVKLWKTAIDYIFHQDRYFALTGKTPSLEEFNQYCVELSVFLNGGQVHSDFDRFFNCYSLPNSLKAKSPSASLQ